MIIPRITGYSPIRFEKNIKQPATSLTGKKIENTKQIFCNTNCTIIVNKYGKIIDKAEEESCKIKLKKGESYILDREGRIDSIKHLDGTQSIFDYFFGSRCIYSPHARINYAHHVNPKTGVMTQIFPNGSIKTETRKGNARIDTYKDKNGKFFMKEIHVNEKLVYHIQKNKEGNFNLFMKTKNDYITKNNISLDDCKKMEKEILLQNKKLIY